MDHHHHHHHHHDSEVRVDVEGVTGVINEEGGMIERENQAVFTTTTTTTTTKKLLCDHFMSVELDDPLNVNKGMRSCEEENRNSNSNSNTNTNSVIVLMVGKLGGDFNIIAAAGEGGKEKLLKKQASSSSSSSAKKPPKHPQSPHRSLSLDADAANQKLIKELAELAMIKRARMDRMKALLMQKKASKPSLSSNATFFAFIFTIIFFFVILFQGMSCEISWGSFKGSPSQTTHANDNDLIFIQEELNLNPSAHDSI